MTHLRLTVLAILIAGLSTLCVLAHDEAVFPLNYDELQEFRDWQQSKLTGDADGEKVAKHHHHHRHNSHRHHDDSNKLERHQFQDHNEVANHHQHHHRQDDSKASRSMMCMKDERPPVMFGPLNLNDYYKDDIRDNRAWNYSKEQQHQKHRSKGGDKHHRQGDDKKKHNSGENHHHHQDDGCSKRRQKKEDYEMRINSRERFGVDDGRRGDDDQELGNIPSEDNENKDAAVSGPPPIDKAALMARYIVNQAGWTSVATVSSRKETESYPFVNVISFSDGPLGDGSGVPYMYLTPLDFTAQDVNKDSRATLMMTLAQGNYCERQNYDPMDPRCARVVLTGKIKTIKPESTEIVQAKNAVFGRHPWLAHMPPDHRFFFAKLKINYIAVLDTFGGPKIVTVKDYFHPNVSNDLANFNFDLEFQEIQRRIALVQTSPTVLNIQ